MSNKNLSSEIKSNLQGLTKAELTRIRRKFDISGISQLNKAELKEALTEEIPRHLTNWLEKTIQPVQEVLSLFLSEGELDTKERLSYQRIAAHLASLGLVGQKTWDDRVYLMPEGIREKFSDVISGDLQDNIQREIELNTFITARISAHLFFYGILPLENILIILEEELGFKPNKDRVQDVIAEYRDIYGEFSEFTYYWETVIYHEAIDNYSREFFSDAKDFSRKIPMELDYYSLSEAEIGYITGNQPFPWEAVRILEKQYLADCFADDYLTRLAVDRLFFQFNLGYSLDNMVNSFTDELSRSGDQPLNSAEIKEIKKLVKKFRQEAHCWLLKGHSLKSKGSEHGVELSPEGIEISPSDIEDLLWGNADRDNYEQEDLLTDFAYPWENESADFSMNSLSKSEQEIVEEIAEEFIENFDEELLLEMSEEEIIEYIQEEFISDYLTRLYNEFGKDSDLPPIDFLQKLERKIDPGWEFKELLANLTEEELTSIRQNYKIGETGQLNKTEQVEALAEQVPAYLNRWLNLINYDLLEYLRNFLAANSYQKSSLDPWNSELESIFGLNLLKYLQDRAVVFAGQYQEDMIQVMPEEIRRVVTRVENKEQFQKRIATNSRLIDYTLGLLVYYGVCRERTMYQLVADYCDFDLESDYYFSVMEEFNNYDLQFQILDSNQDSRYYTYFLVDNPATIIEQQKDSPLNKFYQPTEEEIIYAAANEIPKQASEIAGLEEYLNQKNLSFDKTNLLFTLEDFKISRYFFYLLNNDHGQEKIEYDLQGLISGIQKEDLAKLLEIINDFNDSIPHWSLKGHSPR